MNTDKKQSENKRPAKPTPWKKPEITALSINRDTKQLPPPEIS